MSKAFTKEDDDAGFTLDAVSPRARVGTGPLTRMGVRLARDRWNDVTARLGQAMSARERASLEAERDRMASLMAAHAAPVPLDASAASFGAEVHVRDRAGKERVIVIASVDEIGLVPHAASATSPLARALLGAHAGETVEVDGPRGLDELTVIDVRFLD